LLFSKSLTKIPVWSIMLVLLWMVMRVA